MKTVAAFRRTALWWGFAAVVGISALVNAFAGDNQGNDSVRFVNLPPPGATVTVGDAISEGPAARDIAPLALVDPPADFQFVFAPTIDTASQAELRGEAGLAAHYFDATGAGSVGPLTLNFAADPRALSVMYQSRTHSTEGPGDPSYWSLHGGVYIKGAVYLLFADSGDGEDDTSSYYSPRAALRTTSQAGVTHELAHAIDDRLASPSGFDGVPAWLVEGSAEVEAYTALDAYGFRTYESERRERMSDARSIATTLSTTNNTDVNDVYTLGFLAVDRLTPGGSLVPLRQFWSELGKSGDWQSSFEHAFGTTPEAFEASFDDYRAESFPPYAGSIRGTVRGADAANGVLVWACADSGNTCVYAHTNANGDFMLVVPDDRYTVEFALESTKSGASTSTSTSTSTSKAWFYVVGGVTQDYTAASHIGVDSVTVTGVDVSLSSLQSPPAP